MWTSYFIVLVFALLFSLSVAFVSSLFAQQRTLRISLRWAAGILLAAAYCCWRAFW